MPSCRDTSWNSSPSFRYGNSGPDPVEVLFRTLVDEWYAMVGLNAEINGHRIRAEIKDLWLSGMNLSGKVKRWCEELELLSQVAQNHPHAAYAAYIHGQASKWSFIYRTISGIGHLLEPLA